MGQEYDKLDAGAAVAGAVEQADEEAEHPNEGLSEQNTLGNSEIASRLGLSGASDQQQGQDQKQDAPTADPEKTPPEPGKDPQNPKAAERPKPPHIELQPGKPPTPEQLAEIKKAPGGEEIAGMVSAAQKNYGPYMEQTGARVIVTTSEGNGGKPVLMIVPKNYKPEEKTEVHTHYHGDGNTITNSDTPGSSLLSRIRETQEGNAQAVFVLPANMDEKVEGSRWDNVKSVTRTTDDALRVLGVSEDKIAGDGKPKLNADGTENKNAFRVVSAHSGGGGALVSALGTTKVGDQEQGAGEGLRADRLELRDCLYAKGGSREKAIREWAGTKNGQDVGQVVYLRATPLTESGESLSGAFGDRLALQRFGKEFPMSIGGEKRISHNRANTAIWHAGPDGKGGSWSDPERLHGDYKAPRKRPPKVESAP